MGECDAYCSAPIVMKIRVKYKINGNATESEYRRRHGRKTYKQFKRMKRIFFRQLKIKYLHHAMLSTLNANTHTRSFVCIQLSNVGTTTKATTLMNYTR